MQETNLIFFNLENKIPLEKELFSHYSDDMNFIVNAIADDEALFESVETSGKSLVIGKIENKKDFISLVKLLKIKRKKLKNNSLKVAIFNLTQNKKVEKILATYHCHDFLSLSMNIKTYLFKIDFWARGLKTDLVEKNKKEPDKFVFKSLNKREEEKAKVFEIKKSSFGHYRGKIKKEKDLGGNYSGSVKVVSQEVRDNNGVIHELFSKTADYISEIEKSDSFVWGKELFESGEFVIEIRQKIDDEDKVYLCHFEDLYATELVALFKKEFSLELAPVEVSMSFSYRGEKVEMKNIQGQIVEIEEYNEENHLAVIDLLKVPELEFKKLMKLYYRRQNAINVFMQKAKGF